MYYRPFVNVTGVVRFVEKLMTVHSRLIGVISSNNYEILDFVFFNEITFFKQVK